jgi:hypothetical protein
MDFDPSVKGLRFWPQHAFCGGQPEKYQEPYLVVDFIKLG